MKHLSNTNIIIEDCRCEVQRRDSVPRTGVAAVSSTGTVLWEGRSSYPPYTSSEAGAQCTHPNPTSTVPIRYQHRLNFPIEVESSERSRLFFLFPPMIVTEVAGVTNRKTLLEKYGLQLRDPRF